MKQDFLRRFLESEFGAAPEMVNTGSGSLKARLETPSGRYGVEFARDFLEEHDAGEMETLLRKWNLAGEMRRMEGMEISVSNAGIRLDSSN